MPGKVGAGLAPALAAALVTGTKEGHKTQLHNLHGCAILTWHAGLAPETGFSAPSKEQLWD